MSYVSEKQIKQIAQKISNDYAQKNGSYDDLVSGGSKQLLSDMTINDKAAYNFRTAGGTNEIGDKENDSIIGGSIAWNQLVQNGNFADTSGWSTLRGSLSVANNTATFTLDENVDGNWPKTLYRTISVPANHKVLLSCYVRETASAYYSLTLGVGTGGGSATSASVAIPNTILSDGDWHLVTAVTDNTAEATTLKIWTGASTTSQTVVIDVKNIQVFDLTQMFGLAIADHIYSLEQSTAGAGVAWFKSYFPKEYYDYRAPILASVSVASHDNIGFNAYNPTTSIAKLVGGMEYQITGTYTSLSYSSGETIAPDSDGYFTPSVSGELSVVGGNDSDTCVHLVWDGEKDGEWESYKIYSYPLDKTLTLYGLPKIDSNNNLYYDGDQYKSDGTVIRRYGIIDLGTLTWSKSSITYFGANVPLMSKPTVVRSLPLLCERYTVIDDKRSFSDTPDGSIYNIYSTSLNLGIKDSTYSNAADLKASLAGVYLIYPLATPTTESAAPYQNPQTVDDFGTESYINPRTIALEFSTELTYEVGDFVIYSGDCYRCITAITEAGDWDTTKWTIDNLIVEVPVGHDTEYYPNMRAKLEMAPDSPDGETGNYVVNHTKESGENKYIPFSTAIQNDAGLNNELNRKANIDGYYETLTSGNATQLLSTVKINNKVPYTFRTSGGSADIGDRLDDTIVGGTIVWNQILPDLISENYDANNSVSSVTFDGLIARLTATSVNKNVYIQTVSTKRPSLKAEHKYYFSVDVNPSVGTNQTRLSKNTTYLFRKSCSANIWTTIGGFYSPSSNEQNYIRVYFDYSDTMNFQVNDYIDIKNFVCFDLTQMFGTTIADYIYSLGDVAGVAWFKDLFPKSYYAYNAGEMLSVNVSSHDTVGFNQLSYAPTYYKASTTFDITKVTRVIPGQRYQLSFDGIAGATNWRIGYRFYDLNGTYFGSTTDKPFSEYKRAASTTIPYYNSGNSMYMESGDNTSLFRYMTFAQECYVRIYFVNGDTSSSMSMTNPCFHFVWDGEKDGEFEEYIKHSYPLDSSLTLRGVPMLDANNKLYYDGDIYESDGTVTRRAVKVTLDGSESWGTASGSYNESQYFRLQVGDYGSVITGYCISDKLQQSDILLNNTFKGIQVFNSSTINKAIIAIRPENITDFTSTAQFKEWLAANPITVVYLLSDEYVTTETADPFTNPQIVDDFGTEEYVDYACSQGERDVSIPVGHNTDYYPNLRAKLEVAPDAPDGDDGLYVVSHLSASGENTYVPLPKELPAIPTEDGTYKLSVTVTNGEPTYSWEAQA